MGSGGSLHSTGLALTARNSDISFLIVVYRGVGQARVVHASAISSGGRGRYGDVVAEVESNRNREVSAGA